MRAQREAAAMVMAKGEPPLLLAGWLAGYGDGGEAPSNKCRGQSPTESLR